MTGLLICAAVVALWFGAGWWTARYMDRFGHRVAPGSWPGLTDRQRTGFMLAGLIALVACGIATWLDERDARR